MKIERYLSMLVILIAGLFLVNASWPANTYSATGTQEKSKVKAAKKTYERTAIHRKDLVKPKRPQVRVTSAPTCVPYYAPVNTRNLPASSSGKYAGTICTTCVPYTNVPVTSWNVPATSAGKVQTTPRGQAVTPPPGTTTCQIVTPANTPWGVIGSILRFPFELGQCLFGACPPPPCSG